MPAKKLARRILGCAPRVLRETTPSLYSRQPYGATQSPRHAFTAPWIARAQRSGKLRAMPSRRPPARLVVRRELRVAASPRAVWDALADLPRWPARDRYIQWIRPAGEPPPDGALRWAVGRRYREQVRRGPFRPVFDLTVVEVEDGRRVAWAARYLWVDAVHAWEVAPRDGGETALLVSEETFRGPRVLLAIARVVFRLFTVERMTDRQLAFIAADALDPPSR